METFQANNKEISQFQREENHCYMILQLPVLAESLRSISVGLFCFPVLSSCCKCHGQWVIISACFATLEFLFICSSNLLNYDVLELQSCLVLFEKHFFIQYILSVPFFFSQIFLTTYTSNHTHSFSVSLEKKTLAN